MGSTDRHRLRRLQRFSALLSRQKEYALAETRGAQSDLQQRLADAQKLRDSPQAIQSGLAQVASRMEGRIAVKANHLDEVAARQMDELVVARSRQRGFEYRERAMTTESAKSADARSLEATIDNILRCHTLAERSQD